LAYFADFGQHESTGNGHVSALAAAGSRRMAPHASHRGPISTLYELGAIAATACHNSMIGESPPLALPHGNCMVAGQLFGGYDG
jgi:hypothetical protein